MPMFVTNEPVPVTDGVNTIWVRARMDLGTYNQVQDALRRVGTGGAVELHLGEYNTALMVHNIVRWAGPDLDLVPCTPDSIRRLDPDEPLVALVLARIQELNLARRDPKGKVSSTGGPPGGESR